MWASIRNASSRTNFTKASAMLPLPPRSDFTSLPTRTSPASNRSRMSYSSCRAFRFSAMTRSASGLAHLFPSSEGLRVPLHRVAGPRPPPSPNPMSSHLHRPRRRHRQHRPERPALRGPVADISPAPADTDTTDPGTLFHAEGGDPMTIPTISLDDTKSVHSTKILPARGMDPNLTHPTNRLITTCGTGFSGNHRGTRFVDTSTCRNTAIFRHAPRASRFMPPSVQMFHAIATCQKYHKYRILIFRSELRVAEWWIKGYFKWDHVDHRVTRGIPTPPHPPTTQTPVAPLASPPCWLMLFHLSTPSSDSTRRVAMLPRVAGRPGPGGRKPAGGIREWRSGRGAGVLPSRRLRSDGRAVPRRRSDGRPARLFALAVHSTAQRVSIDSAGRMLIPGRTSFPAVTRTRAVSVHRRLLVRAVGPDTLDGPGLPASGRSLGTVERAEWTERTHPALPCPGSTMTAAFHHIPVMLEPVVEAAGSAPADAFWMEPWAAPDTPV